MSVLSHISRALVVEDDAVLALQLQDFLTDLGSPKTVIAPRLDKAILELNMGVHFAVLDVALSGEPCTELAERLASSGTPFIYFSGYQRDDFPDLPSAPWVNKPAADGHLLAAISSALGQTAPSLSLEQG